MRSCRVCGTGAIRSSCQVSRVPERLCHAAASTVRCETQGMKMEPSKGRFAPSPFYQPPSLRNDEAYNGRSGLPSEISERREARGAGPSKEGRTARTWPGRRPHRRPTGGDVATTERTLSDVAPRSEGEVRRDGEGGVGSA